MKLHIRNSAIPAEATLAGGGHSSHTAPTTPLRAPTAALAVSVGRQAIVGGTT